MKLWHRGLLGLMAVVLLGSGLFIWYTNTYPVVYAGNAYAGIFVTVIAVILIALTFLAKHHG